MYSSLDRIDIVAQDPASGARLLVQTDHRGPGEVEETGELSVLFALARVLNARRLGRDDPTPPLVRYAVPEQPPAFLLDAIAAAGGELELMAEPGRALPHEGVRLDPYELADRTFAALARRVLEREQRTLEEPALAALEEALLDDPPGAEDRELEYWIAVLELAALGGELLRQRKGGRWVEDTQELSTVPFVFDCGGSLYNVITKAQKLIEQGRRESLTHLLRMAEDDDAGEGPTLITFKPPGWPGREQALCRPLLEGEASARLPLLVYGNDRPSSFGIFLRSPEREQRVEEIHAEALRNLAAVEVQTMELQLDEARVIIVGDSYYAAEKLLDVAFMRGLHARLGAPLLAAAVPRKTTLLVTSAMIPLETMAKFLHLAERKHAEDEPTLPLCAQPLLVQDGLVVGFVQAEATPAAALGRN